MFPTRSAEIFPGDKLTFASNKVFKKEGNEVAEAKGNMGALFSQLAAVNCELWLRLKRI